MDNPLAGISMHSRFDQIDQGKLTSLIERALDKTLIDGYYSLFTPSAVLVAEDQRNYLGAIIAEEIMPGIQYLDKVVVDPSLQRNGLGGNLLEMMAALYPRQILRAKPDNPHQAIYRKRAYLGEYLNGWMIYSRSLDDHTKMAAYAHALARPETVIRNTGKPVTNSPHFSIG